MKQLALKVNKRFYYGWVIVLMAAVSFFFSAPGQTYSISVFKDVYQDTLGYDATMLSTGYSIATIISGSFIWFMGKAIDRFGPKKMMIVAGGMLGIVAIYNSFVSSIAMIFVGFFFLRFFGQGSLTLIPNTLVPQWFEKQRALSLSIASFGSLIAMMTVSRFNYWLIGVTSWQFAWRLWGIALLIIFIPLVILFVIDTPERIGIIMENEKAQSDEKIKEIQAKKKKESWTLQEALGTKEFWLIGIMSMVVPMFSTAFTFHFFSLMELKGVTGEQASWIIGLLAFPMIITPFASKLFIDKYPAKWIFMITQINIFVSMGLLLLVVSSVPTAILFILFYGINVAIQMVTLNTLWPNYFGRLYLGGIRGAATVFMVIGSALGPLPLGLSFDLNGNYNAAIIGIMIFTFITILFIFLINKPEKKTI